jgi:putative transposase
MEQQSVHKTFKYKLKPMREQERDFERVLMLCRHVYNAAIGERREAWRMRGVSVTYYQQKAELPDIKEAMPEYGEVNAQVLQDVVLRVDRAFQAFFQRIQDDATPGYPSFHGRDRYNSFTYPQVGDHGGARLDNGFLVLSKIGRIAVRWSRPLEGMPKTVTISREADGWYVCFSCADVPVQSLPETGQETGIDLGIEAFATFSDGTRIFHPGWYRKAERALKTAQRRVSRRKQGSNRRRKAAALLAKARQKVRRQRQDFHHKTAMWCVRTTRSIPKTYRSAIWSRTTISPSLSRTQEGSMRRSLSRRRVACLYEPEMLWPKLRRHRPERFVCPLALLSSVRNEPASGS